VSPSSGALRVHALYAECKDVRQVAAKLGVKVATVRRWLRGIEPPRPGEYERGRLDEREACAAYCLDRADQYVPGSGICPALADAAEGIAKGDAAGMMARGETEDLLRRVRRMSGFTRKTPKVKAKAKA
jgi:hypothetical protein